MYVVATAGHVDHGKSTLVRTLTGMDPDRWEEERRRGLTIDLGFCWGSLPSGATVAFVDVPGHERFVGNMLAGVGPAPAVLFVVAADEGWMPQSAEHLAALDALGVRHGLLVVTRADLADPGPATAQARREIARTSLADVDAVPVSAPTGAGVEHLRRSLDRLVARLPPAEPGRPVRLWIDRSFSVKGSGTVVTGTLAAGRLRVGDELDVPTAGRAVRVRGLQSLGQAVDEAAAVARVAVNLRGVKAGDLRRGDALLTPRRFRPRDVVDVRVHGDAAASLPPKVTFHIGAAAVDARVRPLGADTARLTLARALPLHVADRGLLRDPGRHHICGGCTVLDVLPPPLTRRGAARERASVLASLDGRADERSELARRGLVRRADLEAMGVAVQTPPVAGDWLADAGTWRRLCAALPGVVAGWRRTHPLEPGPPLGAIMRELGLPDQALVRALLSPPLRVRDGRVVDAAGEALLPPAVEHAVRRLRAELAQNPFTPPGPAWLETVGLGPRELAAAERAGAVVRLSEGVVLLPESLDEAIVTLGRLPQPFTVSAARQALGTSRRLAVPLLEYLDRSARTRRLPDDRRVVRDQRGPAPSPPAGTNPAVT